MLQRNWACRNGFPKILKLASQLVDNIKNRGPEADIDINNICMRFSMDVTGLVGFAKDFGTCRTFNDSKTDEVFEVLKAGAPLPPPSRNGTIVNNFKRSNVLRGWGV
jgi:hypothetical protein